MATATDDGVAIHDSTEDHECPAVKRPRIEEPSNVNSAGDNDARAQQSEPGNLSGNDPAEVSEVPVRLIV